MQRAGHVDNLAGLCYNPTFGYLLWWYCTPGEGGGKGYSPIKLTGVLVARAAGPNPMMCCGGTVRSRLGLRPEC